MAIALSGAVTLQPGPDTSLECPRNAYTDFGSLILTARDVEQRNDK